MWKSVILPRGAASHEDFRSVLIYIKINESVISSSNDTGAMQTIDS